MDLATVWLSLLGFLLAGYLVLGGSDLGVQMLRPHRRELNALGPLFFGNEVWLVGAAGVLFGAFPFAEGTLLAGLSPLLVAALAGLVVGKAAVQLRGRAGDHRAWTVLTAVGGWVPAVTWGLVIGVLLHGVPVHDHAFQLSWAIVLDPFVLLCGATVTAVLLAHGAAFLTLRIGAPARRTLPMAAFAVTLVTAGTAVSSADAVSSPVPALVLAVVMLAALAAASLVRRPGPAFAATACAAAVPFPLLGAALHPYLVATGNGGGVTVTQGAADPVTLRLLLATAGAVIPVILVYQAWMWWTFRSAARTPEYF